MIEILVVGVSIIAALLVWVRIMHLKIKALKANSELLSQTVDQMLTNIRTKSEADKALFKVQEELTEKHREELDQMEKGDRSQFNTDSL